MAAGKEIRGKIKSVENTKKITKAMEMVAASKMRKAQERMRSARPYSDKIRNITANLSQANPEYQSPYMRATGDAKAVGFIVLAASRRAGLEPVCPHRLRRTAAVEMLRRGASLQQIAEVLRHTITQTTAIYAKVDRRALRALVQPWPGARS